MTEQTENPQNSPESDETYVTMLDEYLDRSENKIWARRSELIPVVFHLRKICRQLDLAGSGAPAALLSAYLKAHATLDKHRPGAKTSEAGQGSIFDELD